VKTHIFRVEIEQDEEGYWEAEIPTLPGCATWGHSKEEALEAFQEGAQAYLEVLAKHQQPIPKETEAEAVIITDAEEVVAVTL
jgi:antitoxin HicB